MSLEDFPRYPLLFGPSPVHRLDRLTEHLGGAAVWAKREDVNSGIAFGGNKTRKLEYLVADALAQGCDTLVSIGGVQSNHTRQVAAVAARVGLKCVLVQESWVDWPDAVYDKVGNILISRLAGADVRLVKAGFGIGFKESWEAALAEIETRGGKPYAIPGGASSPWTTSSWTSATTPASTASPTRRRSARWRPPPAPRAWSPTPCTRGSRWPRPSTSSAAGRSTRRPPCSTRTSAGSPRSTATARCSPRGWRRAPRCPGPRAARAATVRARSRRGRRPARRRARPAPCAPCCARRRS